MSKVLSLHRWDKAQNTWFNMRTNELVTPEPFNPRDALNITARLYDARPNVGPMVNTFIEHYTPTAISGPNPGHPDGIWYGHRFWAPVTLLAYLLKFESSVFRGAAAGQPSGNAVKPHSSIDNTLGGAEFLDCDIISQDPNNFNNSAFGSGWFTIKRTHIKGFVDGVGVTASTTVDQPTRILGSWIHDGQWGPQAGQSDGQTHNDAIQLQRGKSIEIAGSYLGGHRITGDKEGSDDYNNSCIMIGQSVSNLIEDRIEFVEIYHNIIEGGASGINCAPGRDNFFASTHIYENDFVRRGADVLAEFNGRSNYIIKNSGWLGGIDDNRYLDTRALIPIT